MTVFSNRVLHASHCIRKWTGKRNSLQEFEKLVDSQFGLTQDTLQNWRRKIEAVVPRHGDTEMLFRWMAQLGVAARLMVNLKSRL